MGTVEQELRLIQRTLEGIHEEKRKENQMNAMLLYMQTFGTSFNKHAMSMYVVKHLRDLGYGEMLPEVKLDDKKTDV